MVMDARRASLHLQKCMCSRLEYYSMNLAFFEAANLEPPLWVIRQEYVVYKTYENWRQLKKLQSWSTTSVGRDPLLFKLLEDMTKLELQELRDQLHQYC
jgi:hypothetical protein